ncbi:DUF86 domain-containing protein [Candidatus Uhrbacteria bacterium]|nr:DUF86 domain-containing protein [Candidatus Uhrbacteria bacterium]
MEFDIQKLKTRFAEIREHLEEIKTLARYADEELFADSRNMAAMKYHLLVILEAMGSICVHVCARGLQKAVNEYAECFEFLRDGNIIPAELSGELIKMVRFRSLIVHRYWEADDRKILGYVRTELHTIEDFLKHIGKKTLSE